jgi:hypothetical protein
MQVLVGFMNFYRHFIKKHAKVTSNHRFAKEIEREVGVYWGADIAIQKLKRAFTEAPILQHFDAEKPITLQTDASGFAIAGILNQFDSFGVLRPTSFYWRKCTSAEQNYDTYDRELLAIVASMKQWRHHLEGARYKILIQCDHKNLEYFQTTKVLSRRQARWAEILSAYDFTIEHLDGTKNRADEPSRLRGRLRTAERTPFSHIHELPISVRKRRRNRAYQQGFVRRDYRGSEDRPTSHGIAGKAGQAW